MNRTILTVAGVLGASSLLLLDSAVKGTALLVLAAIAALILRRDSAATRHLVWLMAIVALMAVPVLSALLPEWRVLPEWAGISPESVVVDASPPSISRPADGAVELPRNAAPVEVERPSAPAHQLPADLPDSRPALVTPIIPESAVRSWNWLNALPLVWAIGFSVLILRLMAARWMLWNSECRGTVIGSSTRPATATHDPLVTALEAVCLQLGIRRPVILLIHPDKMIPVVWGILRCRLLLPAAARHWSGEQLRSVLLHELAHIKRRDTMAQLLTQIACALYWFNPLVWFAAWRLGVERERACDDLVLASGVRPSAYAGHLLEIVAGLAPAPWMQSCGLAMARKSSLNGRVVAVLSQELNRRGATTALAAAALLLGVGIAVPLAMLRATEPDKPQAEAAAVNAEPKDVRSRPLFEDWKTSARTDGKIPGGRIGEMAASLKTFMGLNPGHEQSVKLEPVLKKCDASRDWTPAEAAALLDEIAAITPQAEWAMRANTERKIHPGKPLPDELAKAPWGKPAENGLRTAWLLEPRAQTQALDSVMKSRVLFHNTGKAPVCFATENWIQAGGHKAKDANGKDINVWAVSRMGIRLRMIFRLAPGEYAEVEGHGLGVGPHETSSEKSIYKVGCWIEAKLNDEVTFTPANVLVSFQTWQNNEGRKDSITVWQEMIAARVMQESPMPAAAADRELLLRRVMQDFPGTAPTAEEIAAFVADNAKEPLARLIKSLQARAKAMHFAGELSGGETKFRVTAAAPKKDEPKPGAQVKPATEQKLKWGEPANGLRIPPKNKDAQALYKSWTTAARADGKIPGGVIALLGQSVTTFIKNNPTWATTPQLEKMLPRFDASRDWTGPDAVTLLDEVAAVQTTPISMALHHEFEQTIVPGAPLPPELANAPWGKTLSNGLRLAWLLEPRAAEHRLNTPLKSRILIHNVGKESVVFRTRTWHQSAAHKARDAKDADIQIVSTEWTTLARLVPFRLAPGEFVELTAAGIGVGKNKKDEDWQNTRVGSWIDAKEGDDVTFTPAPVPLSDWNEQPGALDGEPRWWLDHIKARLSRHLPFPADAEARMRLLHCVAIELSGTSVSKAMNDAFIADTTPTALDSLAKRLAHFPGLSPYTGLLQSGPTKFRVLPADPDAAKKPRTAINPGRYTLGDTIRLVVSRRPEGQRIVNEASIQFYSADPKASAPGKPVALKLPDGYNTWAAAWVRGGTVLWVMQKGSVRSYDFTNPAQVKETTFEEPAYVDKVPKPILEAFRAALNVPGTPVQQQESQKQAPAALKKEGAEA